MAKVEGWWHWSCDYRLACTSALLAWACVGITHTGTRHTLFIVVVTHVEAFTHSCSACPFTATKSKAVIIWANKTWQTLWYKHFFAFWLLKRQFLIYLSLCCCKPVIFLILWSTKDDVLMFQCYLNTIDFQNILFCVPQKEEIPLFRFVGLHNTILHNKTEIVI